MQDFSPFLFLFLFLDFEQNHAFVFFYNLSVACPINILVFNNLPDGLELLLLALLVGDGGSGEGALGTLNGRGGRRPFLLERVKLVDRLRLHRRRAVVVAYPVVLLLRLDLRQPVPRRPLPEAELFVPVRRHF